jgi:hypothetical protein
MFIEQGYLPIIPLPQRRGMCRVNRGAEAKPAFRAALPEPFEF